MCLLVSVKRQEWALGDFDLASCFPCPPLRSPLFPSPVVQIIHPPASCNLRRPIGNMFYSFRGHAQDTETSEHHPASSGTQISSGHVLYESSLNYFSLYTIGRVRLQWVDTLTAHLAFDRSTRTLYVFRFPSFCVANILCKHDIQVLKK